MPAPRLPRENVIAGKHWLVTEYEEALELRPGLQRIGEQLVDVLSRLGRGERAHGIEGRKLDGNPCWPDELRKNGAPAHERYVLLMPLALSRTQDDKGRIRWTLFGASQHGPERAFRNVNKQFYEQLVHDVYGEQVKYLVTFTPFAELPRRTRDAYLAGDLHLLPFPGSLLFFHAPGYARLARELPSAKQIPLLYSIERDEAPRGIRVPQSGWMHEREQSSTHGPFRNMVKRTNRWTRVHRHEDELPVLTLEQKVTHTLFSAAAEDLGLYGKPMARNSQVWTNDYRLLLDGPNAGREEIAGAIREVDAGGVFGYRFFYPPMRVDGREVFWHRPLIQASGLGPRASDPLGFVTVGDDELTPRILSRERHREIVSRFLERPKTLNNARKILDTYELIGEKLEPSFARVLLRTGPKETFHDWIERKGLEATLESAVERGRPGRSLRVSRAETFAHTTTRAFETKYWRTIARLAHGSYLNKDNADVVLDQVTHRRLVHKSSDLWRLGEHLLAYYKRLGIECEADSFEWETDFDFSWSKGWLDGRERNIIAKIPGRDRSRAVIMADHYDTAYMEDVFGRTGKGARIAAAGADDNHSATAALMLAAPIFRELDLECDIWLVHLTGEEFPADCLGARHLCERIVGEKLDIAAVFVLDMVAHNNRKARDIFQICPGWGREAMLLARTAHEVNVEWNESIEGTRKNARRGIRSKDPRVVPPLAKHLKLQGEVRPPSDGHSTLYNTDGQIFSDTGVPVVLFMENYDINRHGYHDSRDTMANIDLDYGAALVSIAIETVARTAGATTTASSSRPRSRGAAASRRGRRRSR